MKFTLTGRKKIFSEAVELAKRGDDRAILKLQRAIKLSPDSDNAKVAKEVLNSI